MNINKKHKQMIKAGIATSLLLSYVFAFLFIDVLHTVKHSSFEPEHCTVQQEKDKCHKSIYHHDTENGCKHSEHLINPKEKCDLCVASFIKKPKQGLDLAFHSKIQIPNTDNYISSLKDFKESSFILYKKTRGPPMA